MMNSVKKCLRITQKYASENNSLCIQDGVINFLPKSNCWRVGEKEICTKNNSPCIQGEGIKSNTFFSKPFSG